MTNQTALHDPLAVATPSQREACKARHDRQARLRSAAIQPGPVPPPKPKPETVQEWAARQFSKTVLWSPAMDIEIPDRDTRPKIEAIQRVVARHYNVSRNDILSPRRTANVVRPRQVAMYLAKTLTLRSLPEIGRRFGSRDHTTVIHAVRKIARLVAADCVFAEEIQFLTQSLQEAT